MHNLRSNGDSLAQEFAKILNKNAPKIEKLASSCDSNAGESMAVDSAEDNLEDAVAEMLVDDSAPTGGDVMINDSIDNAVSNLASYSADSELDKEAKLMQGLSKIASSLRAKNESFAADVVEATALSIKKDIEKEANLKATVSNELKKIANDLSKSGDEFSADMVRVTLDRIINY